MTGRPLFFAPVIVAALFGAVACIFWPTVSYLLGIGRDTDNSTHGALVVIVVWVLIWNQRAELANLPIRPYLLGIIGLIGLGFAWLAGELVFMRVLTQFAVLAMIPMAVLTLLGFRWLVAMAFPLFVLMFAVPVWSPLVPTLVKWSANFAELAIRASGVPVYRDGAFFVISSGTWSIADTCSGVAFLSTCLLLGVLYAWTIYRSPMKRIVFIAGSAAIGVVGNWIRVYLTIMIAHLTDNRILRDDHYTFGWFLFAVFLFVFCWLGWRYRDTEQLEGDLIRDGVGTDSSPLHESSVFRLASISALMLGTLVAWPLVESGLLERQRPGVTEIADISPQGEWFRVAKPSVEWVPEISSPTQVRIQAFEKNGRHVDVFVGVYRNETWESKLVSASNLLAGGDKSNWGVADRGTVRIEMSGTPFEAKTGVVLSRTSRVLAWHWYWIHGVSTGNDLRAKYEQLLTRFEGVRAGSAWVAIYTEASGSSDVSSILLEEFIRDMGGALESALVRTNKQ